MKYIFIPQCFNNNIFDATNVHVIFFSLNLSHEHEQFLHSNGNGEQFKRQRNESSKLEI